MEQEARERQERKRKDNENMKNLLTGEPVTDQQGGAGKNNFIDCSDGFLNLF